MEKVRTSISIDKDVYEFVKKLSENECRSFSQQLSLLLKKSASFQQQNIDLRAAQ